MPIAGQQTSTHASGDGSWHGIVLQTLKRNEISLVPYVPDRVLTPLIRNLHADPFFTTFATAREEEAAVPGEGEAVDEGLAGCCEATQFEASDPVEEAHGLVRSTGRQQQVVLGNRDRLERCRRTGKRPFIRAVGHVPQLDRLVGARG